MILLVIQGFVVVLCQLDVVSLSDTARSSEKSEENNLSFLAQIKAVTPVTRSNMSGLLKQ